MISIASDLDKDGFAIAPGVIPAPDCDRIAGKLAAFQDGAGSRKLLQQDWCSALARQLKENPIIRGLLPPGSAAIQCTFFDKSAEKNWLVTLHQDLSVPVRSRVSVPGFSGWSEKEGGLFVQPPKEILEGLVGVRLHLDACGSENGPLRVVPGSHRAGRLSDAAARALRDKNGEVLCIVPKGGVLILRPLLLHSSSKAQAPSHRRVLHFMFGPVKAPHGLEWADAI